jgi:hypothetical protein
VIFAAFPESDRGLTMVDYLKPTFLNISVPIVCILFFPLLLRYHYQELLILDDLHMQVRTADPADCGTNNKFQSNEKQPQYII